ncbi:hypothetical protein DFH07DRAFT_768084 [Mycena maculata]|uniref:Uncharacterized protein n=1 Tax=Mycena maculata TaxID=230809 RepID=A0AAD7JUG7_9AGAR|nr:hypothetical protein DFH07DRAFT_768084 [Mycena maculata]
MTPVVLAFAQITMVLHPGLKLGPPFHAAQFEACLESLHTVCDTFVWQLFVRNVNECLDVLESSESKMVGNIVPELLSEGDLKASREAWSAFGASSGKLRFVDAPCCLLVLVRDWDWPICIANDEVGDHNFRRCCGCQLEQEWTSISNAVRIIAKIVRSTTDLEEM